MFGYVMINKAEMKFKDFDVYHAYYCGLCQTLKKRYGKFGQLTLSYDLTFVNLLLASLYEPEVRKGYCRCVAHPLEKHEIRTSEITKYVADMNVLLAVLKCEDDWKDEKKLHKKLLGKILSGKNCKERRAYREKENNIRQLLSKMHELEEENCQDIDCMAGLFGQVMSQIMVYREDEWKPQLERFGFYLGKFIYIMDAYDDVAEDIKKKRYNPLISRYGAVDFEEQVNTILTMMMAECCKVFEQLPLLEYVDTLRNVLYSGVWCRYEIVRNTRAERRLSKGRK